MRVRGRVLVALALAAVLLPFVDASHSIAAVGPPQLPANGALFGAYVPVDPAHTGSTRQSAIAAVETAAGRQLALDREYYLWDQVWPTADDTASASVGRTLYLSWAARRSDKTFIQWSAIANGTYDALIDARANDLKSFGYPVYFSFNHEPENDQESGNAQQFIAAYRHVVDRFRADGVTNVSYAWTMMAWSFRQKHAAPFYPGDAWVDVAAADGYTWYGCNNPSGPWRSFTEVFKPFYEYGLTINKPLLIAEWGATEDAALPGRKATWINEASTQLKLWPAIKGVMYFDTNSGCARWLDSSASSLAAFAAMGADPYFNPPPTLTIDSGPAIWVSSTSASFAFHGSAPGGVGYRCALDAAAPTVCSGGTASYSAVPGGDHVFSVWQTDAGGTRVGGVAQWSWTVAAKSVKVTDSGFSPVTVYPNQGDPVLWSFTGNNTHSVADTSGLQLFDTGGLPKGSTFSFTFVAAGSYPYASKVGTSMKGTVKVPVVITPGSGGAATTFTVRWATAPPGAGLVYDVQLKRPGGTWTQWSGAWGTAATSKTFVPGGTGTFGFRARVRRWSVPAQTGWSGAKNITVS